MKLLTSDNLTFGITEIIDAVFGLVRLTLYYLHIMMMKEALMQVGWLDGGIDIIGVWGIWVGVFGVHIWWMLGESL